MRKSNAENQAAHRLRHTEKLDTLEQKLDVLLAKVDYITIAITASGLRKSYVSGDGEAKPRTPPPADERKRRLPTDWMATDDEKEYARKLGLDPTVTEQKFYNHFRSAPRDKWRIDYHLTWCNWCIEEGRRQGKTKNGHDPTHDQPTPEEIEIASRKLWPELYK